jgi:ATP/maltotriose-dependent transcriptional regulator MalT
MVSMPAAVVKLSQNRRPRDDHAVHSRVGVPGRSRSGTGDALLAMMASAAALLEETARLQRQTLTILQAVAAQTGTNASIEAPGLCHSGPPAPRDRREPPPRRARGRDQAMMLAEPLTAREETVLRLLRSPLSLRQISQELYVSHNTIKTHTRAIYRKLGVSSRHDAVEHYRQLATPTT